MHPVKIKIDDDSGIIAVVNPGRYNATLSRRERWTLGELREFFFGTNKGNLVIWATGMEETWTVSAAAQPSARRAFRQFTQNIEVTNGGLLLVAYDELFKTLQFAADDDKLPADKMPAQTIALENGSYRLTVRQMFDPADDDYDADGQVNFELCFEPRGDAVAQDANDIVWYDDGSGGGFFSDDRAGEVFLSNEPDAELDAFLSQLVEKHKQKIEN